MNYIKRNLENVVRQVTREYPVLLVTGPRQVGKTTMLKKLMEGTERGYVTLDDLNERNIAKTDPELFLQLHKPPVLIDEVQYAPELFTYIKINVDKNHEPGAFWLTGSQVFKLMQGVQESLAGRVAGSSLHIPVTGRDIRRNDETVYGRSGGFKREAERERAS